MTRSRTDASTEGVCFAKTEDGFELPVVDITNPAFSCELSDEALDAIAERTRRGLERSRRLPAFVLRLLGRRSVIMRDMLRAGRGFVSGMTTYLFKLGPDNLPLGFGDRLDRRMLAGIGPVSCRLRLREMARQIADALVPILDVRGGPLRLMNIAGGVAADAFNALILLARERPTLLAERSIRIEVLDSDAQGPAFGFRAVAALREDHGQLAGLDVELSHTRYDWSAPSTLGGVLAGTDVDAVLVGSSEGGLFEYAEDEVVAANLAVLRDATPSDFALVGSLVRDDNLPWLTGGDGAPGLRPHDLRRFGDLAAGAGWTVARASSNPMYHVITLTKARP